MLVDRTNHHLFQPLLYQVATAGLSAPAVSAPIRHVLRPEMKRGRLTILKGEVQAIDVAAKTATLDGGERIAWDHLIVAAGSTHSYFGHDEWSRFAPGLKTLADALKIRARVINAFENAERAASRRRARRVAHLRRHRRRPDRRRDGRHDERDRPPHPAARVPPHRPDPLARDPPRGLRPHPRRLRAGAVGAGARAARATARHRPHRLEGDGDRRRRRHLRDARRRRSRRPTASRRAPSCGRPASPARRSARSSRAARARRSTAPAASSSSPTSSIAGHPEISVIGDLAAATTPTKDGRRSRCPASARRPSRWAAPPPPTCCAGSPASRPRRFATSTTATSRPSAARRRSSTSPCRASAQLRFGGLPAWLFWLFAHVYFLIGFRNRLIVMVDWAWAYFTYERGARVVAERDSAAEAPP